MCMEELVRVFGVAVNVRLIDEKLQPSSSFRTTSAPATRDAIRRSTVGATVRDSAIVVCSDDDTVAWWRDESEPYDA